MGITVTRQSDRYDAAKVDGRYVKQSANGRFYWIETQYLGKWRYDVREGSCDREDLPAAVAEAAERRHAGGVWPFYVDWPR